MPRTARPTSSIDRAPTGIEGLDALLGGGLPRGRATVLVGGPGAGKSVLALQALVEGARRFREPGILVAFEEDRARIIANASGLGWDIPALERRNLFLLNAQPHLDVVSSGSFDLEGLLSALDGIVRAKGAKRIVFDAVDVVTSLLEDPAARRRELYRLHEWLLARKLTTIFTAKTDGEGSPADDPLPQMQFMVDCVIKLVAETTDGLSHRYLRVTKYRGSDFVANDSPMVIGATGVEVVGQPGLSPSIVPASSERLSTGVQRLDAMLNGGYFRGSTTLITGAPGTAKSTLAGAFAAAACARGESTLYVSFDSQAGDIIRNLASVGFRLERFVRSGRLTIHSDRSGARSAELHFLAIRRRAHACGARCLVIDPISALGKTGSSARIFATVERLVDWTRRESITLLCTSLLDEQSRDVEGSPLQVSAIADTWIQLSNVARSGERNRALTVIKSRGTSHSNQVRELILSDSGVTLADVFVIGGDVLMGTMRWEHERLAREAELKAVAATLERRNGIDQSLAALESRLLGLQAEIALKREERAQLQVDESGRLSQGTLAEGDLGRRRRIDAPGKATR